MMAILLGMALGGIIATALREGHPPGRQSHLPRPVRGGRPPALVAVFILTLAALYGLGMMSAPLFLLWGREAWAPGEPGPGAHLPPLRLLFPGQESGILGGGGGLHYPADAGAGRDAATPLSLRRRAGVPFGPGGGRRLAVLCVLFLAAARWLLGYMERIAVREGRLLESRR